MSRELRVQSFPTIQGASKYKQPLVLARVPQGNRESAPAYNRPYLVPHGKDVGDDGSHIRPAQLPDQHLHKA